jgi:hypothetical protein
MDKDASATQLTKPKKGEPIEIPVPKRGEWDSLVERATKSPTGGAEREVAQPGS